MPDGHSPMGDETILKLQRYGALRPMLYHCTAPVNLACIQQTRTLCSSAALAPDRVRVRRTAQVRVNYGRQFVELRDQLPLRPGQVCLTGGWTWEDLIAAINARIFFWPGNQDGLHRYGRNFIDAYSSRGQRPTTLRIGFWDLVQANPGTVPYFCKFNSGAPRTSKGRKSPRGPDTFQTAEEWSRLPSDVAEVSFVDKVALPQSVEVCDAAGWRPL
jgi:hypothetical protein